MSDSTHPGDAEVEQSLLGPESVAWQFGSDARLHFIALYPLLLQVAHPTSLPAGADSASTSIA